MKAARCKIRGLKSNLHSRKQVHGGRTAGLLEFVAPTILYETSPGRLERGCSAMVGGLLTGAVRCSETVRQGSADRLPCRANRRDVENDGTGGRPDPFSRVNKRNPAVGKGVRPAPFPGIHR